VAEEEYVLADSGVVSRLTAVSKDSTAYHEWIGSRRIAISFQTEAELLGCNFGADRMQRLNDLLATVPKLSPTGATVVWYSRVAERKREFQKANHIAGEPGEGDLWIISSALEHRLDFFSHDGPAVQLARAMDVRVFTNLPGLRDGNPQVPQT
jgi:predicted nucleic acid-binding protein